MRMYTLNSDGSSKSNHQRIVCDVCRDGPFSPTTVQCQECKNTVVPDGILGRVDIKGAVKAIIGRMP